MKTIMTLAILIAAFVIQSPAQDTLSLSIDKAIEIGLAGEHAADGDPPLEPFGGNRLAGRRRDPILRHQEQAQFHQAGQDDQGHWQE